jgi:hypothetical protein
MGRSRPEQEGAKESTVWAIVAALVIGLLCVGGLWLLRSDVVATEIVSRHPSPDKAVDAVLLRKNGGATTSFAYHVILVAAGDDGESGESVLVVDSVEEPEKLAISWADHEHLRVVVPSAQVFRRKTVAEVGTKTIHVEFAEVKPTDGKP